MPPRYREPWLAQFDALVDARLKPGLTILDLGGGRHPCLEPNRRPRNAMYIGLDADSDELAAAGDAYDRAIVARAEAFVPELERTVDLAVSWQVFEHFSCTERALRNIGAYLRLGGTLVSSFSGRWSAFGVLNRLLPGRISAPVVDRVMHRSAMDRPIFPAYYDACYASAVRSMLADWSAVEITPLYRGASYFAFAEPLLRAYLAYENLAERRRWANLATHYLLVATR